MKMKMMMMIRMLLTKALLITTVTTEYDFVSRRTHANDITSDDYYSYDLGRVLSVSTRSCNNNFERITDGDV